MDQCSLADRIDAATVDRHRAGGAQGRAGDTLETDERLEVFAERVAELGVEARAENDRALREPRLRKIAQQQGGTGDGRPSELRARNLETGEEVVLLQRPLREIRVATDGSMVSFCRSKSHFDMNLEVLRLLAPEEPGGLPRPAGEP